MSKISKVKGHKRSKSKGESDSCAGKDLTSSCRSIATYFEASAKEEDRKGVVLSGPWSEDVVFSETDEEDNPDSDLEEVKKVEDKPKKLKIKGHRSPERKRKEARRVDTKVTPSSEEDNPDSDLEEVIKVEDKPTKQLKNGHKIPERKRKEVPTKVIPSSDEDAPEPEVKEVKAKPDKWILKLNGRKSPERKRKEARSVATKVIPSSDNPDSDVEEVIEVEVEVKPEKLKIKGHKSPERKRKEAKRVTVKVIPSDDPDSDEVTEVRVKPNKLRNGHKIHKRKRNEVTTKVIPSSEKDDPDSDEVIEVEAKPKKLKTNGETSSRRKSLRSSCRSIASYFEASTSSSSSSSSEEEVDLADSDFEEVKDKPKKSRINGSKSNSNRKRKSAKTAGSKSIASYFGGKSPTPSPKDEKKKQVLKKRKLDPATLAFLSSGVPEVVVRAQKAVDLKKEEDEFLSLMGFFPKIHNVNSNNPELEKDLEESLDKLKIPMKKEDPLDEDLSESEELNLKSFFQTLQSSPAADLNNYQFCCNLKSYKASSRTKKSSTAVPKGGTVDNLPWIDRLKADSVKTLVVNGEGVEKLKQWLKQWKLDIKDSGGICRKVEKKKRKKGSDSEFVDSDEDEDEIKNKSVLLSGPSGCGKSAAVYVLAKRYGFYVVEVNFSTRRSGKDVLQRVEEAVLSHHLESSQNCLLLFKDIDLLDAEEDEGFHAAVAQLISTAVRPIVMTTCLSVNSFLEGKIERRNPLRIHFNYPHARELVDKVLLPNLFQLSGSSSSPSKELQDQVKAQLDSLCRHNRGDIRQSINQAQFLFTSGQPVPNETLHMHSTSSSELLDFWHVIPTHSSDPISSSENAQSCDEDDQLCLTLKARKKLQLQELESISSALSSLSDLDLLTGSSTLSKIIRCDTYREEYDVKSSLSSLHSTYFYPDFISKLKNSSEVSQILLKRLTFESDLEVEKAERATSLREELDEYLDSYGEGSWAPAATLRTIIKQNVMDSVGRLAKRNGRVTNYFNRLDKGLVTRVCNTFRFSDELEAAKEFVHGQGGPF